MPQNRKKLIVILGPTATGKTKLAVNLAKKFNGEIVSADSRQVYRGMDIGTGKDLAEYRLAGRQSVPYHLIDIASPKTDFNVVKYQKLAYQAIDDILARGRTPFLVGGAGLYLDAVIKGYQFAGAESISKEDADKEFASKAIANTKKLGATFTIAERKITAAERRQIRKKLARLSLPQLLARLKKIDPETFKIIDQKNRRRVQRALEIFFEIGQAKSCRLENKKPAYEILILGLDFPLKKIYEKIDARLKARLKQGLIPEIKRLRRQGVSWQRLEAFGLEYRYGSRYWRGRLSYEETVAQLRNAIHHFAKRQLTWFKRNPEIVWLAGASQTIAAQAEAEIKKFLKRQFNPRYGRLRRG